MSGNKKIFTKTELKTISAEEIIEKIKKENCSLLTSLGGEKLRKEMVPVGKICNLALNYFLGTTGPKLKPEKHVKYARKKLVRILAKVTPDTYKDIPTDRENGLVVGFNHPSLGEIPRILAMKMDIMGDKPMYFPVNLPWYEALAPNFERIKKFGIILTPTITPSTWKKLDLKEGSVLYKAGKRIKREFMNIYKELSKEAMLNGGVIFVAPSATRQATVFKNRQAYLGEEKILPTMSVLAQNLYENPDIHCDFLPMAVLPPENYSRGLNLRKNYQLIPGEIMTAAEIREKYLKDGKNPKDFDHDFLERIAQKLPKKFWFWLD